MSKYFKLRVEEVTRETPDTISIRFAQPEGARISYKPGQFLTLLVNMKGDQVRRSYSMSSCPHTDDFIVVTVKRVADGRVSNFLNDTLKPGDTMEVMEPMGNFYIDAHPSKRRHVVLIGAGSGITPLISIAKTVLFAERESQVSLLYGNRNEKSIIFRQELDGLEKQYEGRFKVIHVLSQPASEKKSSFLSSFKKVIPGIGNNTQQWTGHTGRLNQSLVLKLLPTLPQWEADRTEYFLCGPVGMMEEMKHALSIMHVPANRIHWESFVITANTDKHGQVETDASLPKTAKAVGPQEVTVIYEGSEYKFAVPPDKTILEAALDLDIDLPYSCQSGNCTACRGKCLSGKVKLDEEDGLSEYELKEGYVLTCVGHPLTEGVVIEIG
jgi:ring-1,2-phenylacetyl-CoA epoxidase subunit PaaE